MISFFISLFKISKAYQKDQSSYKQLKVISVFRWIKIENRIKMRLCPHNAIEWNQMNDINCQWN